MIIAHLPAGYLFARAVLPAGTSVPVFTSMLIGSVLPDIDILWFYLIDQRSQHHHDYLTHRPALWALLAGLALIAMLSKRGDALWCRAVMALGVGAMFHLGLDSIAGKIAWGWPITDMAIPLVMVPATQSHWLLSFILHWTFAVEISLCVAAALLLRKDLGKRG